MLDYAFEIGDPKIVVCDVDGTLVRTDLLVEAWVQAFSNKPFRALRTFGALGRGKAAFKAAVASEAVPDPTLLPYNQQVLDWLRQAKERGARLYLASAADARLVEAVAHHLQIFDGWFASDGRENLSGQRKAIKLREAFNDERFSYLGDALVDMAIWQVAASRIGVDCSAQCRRQLTTLDPNTLFIDSSHNRFKAWVKLLRVRQYAKNALVAVPLLVSHAITPMNILMTLVAIVAFSLCASSVYILNDLMDIDADRKHPTKRQRPLAVGKVPILAAVPVALLLMTASLGLALAVGWRFCVVLSAYLAITTAYTISLKRKMVIDGITLAILYTCRVIAGAAAIHVVPSEWLLGFSMFIFSSLAFIKRYIELAMRQDEGHRSKLSNRNYHVDDLFVVGSIAAACGFNAVTFLALYISSDSVRKLYSHPQWLWLICPVMMYWIGRNLMLAHRRLMDDDPIVFALRDIPSLATAGIIAIVSLLATL